MTRSNRSRVAVAAIAAVSVVAAGCGWGDSDEAVMVETDPAPADPAALSPAAQREISAEASFAQSDEASSRVTPDGIELSVSAQYHEPIEIDEWTAPPHCSFATTATLEVQGVALSSEGFDGPTSNLDEATGVLGAALDVELVTGDLAPGDPATGEPATGEPGVVQPAVVIAVAAFGHDRVATLRLAGTEDLDSPWGTSDTQPLDGWTPLAVAAPADHVADHGVPPVQLDLSDLDGSEATSGLVVDRAALAVLTNDWVFDLERVGQDCEPPEGEAGNEVEEPEEHIFGGPIAEKPTLPPSVEDQPADPVAATEAAMTAIRTVYDLSDALSAEAQRAKAPYVEDPDRLLAIIQDLIAANLPVEAYMDELVPVFDGLVFLSPTEAAVSYQVGPSYHWEIGRVLLIDGRWRVALGTVCRDLLDANFRCADVLVDPPPGPLG